MSKRTLLCGTILGLILAGVSRPASAEWFVDLYGGGAFTQDADITIHDGTPLKATLKFDTEATGGGRVGYYLTGIGLPGSGSRWMGRITRRRPAYPTWTRAWRSRRSRRSRSSGYRS